MEPINVSTLGWVKSGRSSGQGNCVEVARTEDGKSVALRDSKQPDGPVLFVEPDDWTAFLGGARDGDFDRI